MFERLPSVGTNRLAFEIAQRILRLTCVVRRYAPLWEAIMGTRWTLDAAATRAAARRSIGVEIDALVAISLGITADELCTIYRTQFPVLYGYDRRVYFYDSKGRLVPNSVLNTWRSKGDAISDDERRATHPGSGVTHTYELPFATIDREEQIRQAFNCFADYVLPKSENAS